MNKATGFSSLGPIWHPSDEDLLLYCDGELSHRRAQKVRTHLSDCWPCRARQEDVAQSIYRITKYRHRVLDARLGRDLQRDAVVLRRFEAKLRTAITEIDQAGDNHQRFRCLVNTFSCRRLALQLVPAVLVAGLVVLILFRLNSSPAVSAAEILHRSIEAQDRVALHTPEPVVYQKLRVLRNAAGSRPSEAITWELWNDAVGRRFRQRVEDAGSVRLVPRAEPQVGAKSGKGKALPSPVIPLLSEVEHILLANHMDRQYPLSPVSYRAWRGSTRVSNEEVVEVPLPQGGEGFQITTSAMGPYPEHSIISAELTVRRQDLHPVQQRLQVQASNGTETYELTEQDFQIMTLSSLPPSVFSDAAVATPIPVPLSASAPKPVVPSELELLEAETQARYALHQLESCLGEPIEVVRSRPEGVGVRGLVSSSQRKEELTAVLKTLTLLKLSIQTVDEAMNNASGALPKRNATGAPSTGTLEEKTTKFEDGRLPIQSQLERYFSQLETSSGKSGAAVHLQVAELSKQAVSLWERVMADAWALRRIAESDVAENAARLRPLHQTLLRKMARDHIQGLAREVSQAKEALSPILASLSFEEAVPSETKSAGEDANVPLIVSETSLGWNAVSLGLFDRVEETRTLIHGLFAGSGLEIKESEAVHRFLVNLPEIEKNVQALEAQVLRELSKDTEQISQNQK
jgi:hypothetical protein